jgi:hypothetical protein
MLKLLDKLRSWASLWAYLATAGVVGLVTAWLASLSTWIGQYGAIGWWTAFLVAVLFVAIVFAVASWALTKWEYWSALRQWRAKVSDFNPLAPTFNLQRLKFADLAHPTTKRILNKTFTDCELLGPANLVFAGRLNLHSNMFMHCDMIMLRQDRNAPRNAIVLENADLTRCKIFDCTVLFPPDRLEAFMSIPTAYSLSWTNTDYDSRNFEGVPSSATGGFPAHGHYQPPVRQPVTEKK